METLHEHPGTTPKIIKNMDIQITWSFSFCCYVSETNTACHIENYAILFLLISSFIPQVSSFLVSSFISSFIRKRTRLRLVLAHLRLVLQTPNSV